MSDAYITGFNKLQFSNDLLISMNSNANELDLVNPIKKLNFELIEMNQQIEAIVHKNYNYLNNELLINLNFIDGLNIDKAINFINYSFNKLSQEFMDNYHDLNTIINVYKKIHMTLNYLKNLIFLIYLIIEFEELKGANLDANLAKLAKNLNLFKYQILDNSTTTGATNNLKIIRDYKLVYERNVLFITNTCERNILNSRKLDPIVEQSCVSLNLLDESNETLIAVVNKCLTNSINLNINKLVKTFTSPRNFNAVFSEVCEDVYNNLFKLSQFLDSKLGLNLQLLRNFWKEFALQLDKYLKNLVNKGGPVTKMVRTYGPQIKNSIRQGVVKSSDDLRPDSIEVRMMLNAVVCLERK